MLLIGEPPLCDIPEADVNWFQIYHKNHRDELQMLLSKLDPCLLYAKNRRSVYYINYEVPGGFTINKTDTVNVCNRQLVKKEAQ